MSTPVVLVLVVVLGGLWVASLSITEPGPNPVAVLARRYGVWPFLAAVLGLVLLVLLVAAPQALTAVVAACVAVAAVVCVGLGWGPGTWRRAARRAVLRARWTSVARSSGLAVQRDHRVPGIGADSGTLTDVVRLEWTPVIRRGRALPDGRGVVYQLQPARGSSLPEIAEHVERLAAGLHVGEVKVDRLRPDLGRLTVVWSAL